MKQIRRKIINAFFMVLFFKNYFRGSLFNFLTVILFLTMSQSLSQSV